MKKISALVLVVVLALSVAACGSNPPATTPSSKAASTASVPSSVASVPASSSQPVVEVEKYVTPKDYIPGYGEAMLPQGDETPVVVAYHPAVKTLSDALKKDLAWPTELNEDWKGWGYSDITMTSAGYSLRTTTQVKFYMKHSDQIKTETKNMTDACPEVTYNERGTGANGVPYSEITVPAGTDMQKVKQVTYSALLLQTWSLIPEQFLGVTVTVGDKVYTTAEVLAA